MSRLSEKIIGYISSIYGSDGEKKYKSFVEQPTSQFIRINLNKISPEYLSSILNKKYNITTKKIYDFENIYKVIDKKNIIGKTLEHALGYYYIQSLSSAIPPIVLQPNSSNLVLDLCSAPGSKTTGLAEAMQNKGTLVANEIQLDRLKSLVFNIDRMNVMNVGVLHSKGEILSTIYNDYFDKILVDAPCSGLGIIQKKIEINDWWTLEHAKRLSELQLKLLISAIKMLKVGGELVYSTCTLTVEENELLIDKILRKYPVDVLDFNIKIPSQTGITFYNNQPLNSQLLKAKRILPWEVESDGFFIIKMIKNASLNSSFKSEHKKCNLHLLDASDKKIANSLKSLGQYYGIDENILSNYKYIKKADNIFFINNTWNDLNLESFVRIGARFGNINKNGQIVLHSQAAQVLSRSITKNIFDLSDSIELKQYLEGSSIKKAFLQNGYYLIKYKDYFLGTAVCTDGKLKSQFPRSRRTQEIYLN